MKVTLSSCLLFLLMASSVQATLTSALSSYNTLASSVTYTLTLTFSSINISAGSQLNISFSTNYNINSLASSSCTYLTNSGSSYSPTSCTPYINATNTTIIFTSIYNSIANLQTSLSVQFVLNNPWAATTQYYTFSVISSGTSILSQWNSINFVSSPLNNCTLVSSSPINSALATRTISFIPSVPIIAGSYLSITQPTWFNEKPSLNSSTLSCTPISNIDTTTPKCSYTLNTDNEEFKIQNIFNFNKTATGAISISLSTLLNPWSTYPSGPTTYKLMYISGSTNAEYQSCTGVTLSTSKMATLTNFELSWRSTSISASNTNRNANMTISSVFPSNGGQIQVSWSGGVSMSFTNGSSPYQLSNTSSSFMLVNFGSDYTQSTPISFINNINWVNPKSSRTFTITFTTYYAPAGIGTTTYGMETLTRSFNCLAGVLTPATVTAGSNVINRNTTISLTITLKNAIYSGSYIGVTFPQSLTAIVGSTCSTNYTNITCSVPASNYGNLTVSGTVLPPSVINITFSTITTAQQALTTTSFSIITYIDNALDGIIDRVTDNLTLSFNAKQLPANGLLVLADNKTTYATTTYTFSINLTDPIPSNGRLILTFPKGIYFNSPSIASGTTFSTSTCSLNYTNTISSSNNLTLNSCFPSGLTNGSISLMISGITNPGSLATSDAFQVFTFGSIGLVNYYSNGQTVTMLSIAQSTSFSVTPTTSIVHETTSYTFLISFYGTHYANQTLNFTLPSSLSFSGTPSCLPNSGITSLNCTISNGTVIIVLNVNPASTIKFTITNIVNYDVSNTPVSFTMTVYDALGYKSEQTPSATVTFNSTTLNASVIQNNGIALNQASNITLNITTPFTLSSSLTASSTSLQITIPAEFQLLANSSCSITNFTCTLSSSTFVVSGIGLSVVGALVTLSNILLPNLNGSSSSFTVKYLYSGQIIAQSSSGITLTAYCNSPCQRCTSLPSACLSCLPSPNTMVLFYTPNSSCISSCPNATYLQNNTCNSCVSPCLLCSSATTCLSCISPFIFFSSNSSCLSSCPSGYYNQSVSCSQCVSPCGNCTSATFCLTCSINYFYNNSCVPASSCPSGTYANTTTKSCENCSSTCATCNQSTSCLSCAGGFFFYINSCINSCPNGTYLSGSNCLNCSSSCVTCSQTSTKCLSCSASLVLYAYSCSSSCPNGTYNSSGVCNNCSSICTTCSSSSICNSCTSSYFLLSNFTCSNNCPSYAFPDNIAQACTNCSNNCLTCSLSATNCTSCSSSFLFYNNSCANSCPSNYFNVSGNCQTCSFCNQCLNASACAVCQTGYYIYGGICYLTCPTAAPVPDITLMICTLCGNTCSSCSADASNCFTCNAGYLSLSGKCYATCPSGYEANYSSNSCTAIKVVSNNYYPASITVGVLLLMVILSKFLHQVTNVIGNFVGFVSLGCFFSTLVMIYNCIIDETLPARLLATVTATQKTLLTISIAAAATSVFIGTAFIIYLCCKLDCDAGLQLWRQRYKTNKYVLNVCLVFTCLRVGVLRITYSQIFGRECFSCYVYAHGFLLKITNFFSIISIALCSIPTIALTLLIVTSNSGVTQTQIYAMDCLILASLQVVCLIIDMCAKNKQHFNNILKYLPYLRKFKKYREQESSDGSLISLQENQEAPHCKTEADNKPQILIQNFGVFSEERHSQARSIVKTLPQHNNLNVEVTFDPYQQKRINDQMFFQQRQYTKKFNQLKEGVRNDEDQQDQNQNEGTQIQNYFQLHRSNNPFLSPKNDKTVVQIINEIPREIDPAKYLQSISSEDYKQISAVQLDELYRLAKKHEVDINLMKELFGIRKYHNSILLNQVLDHKQQPVPSQAVQELINSNNSQQKLQSIFSRDSLIEADKLRSILRDPQSSTLLKKLFNKEDEIFAQNTLKALLSAGYSTEFVKNLVSSDNVDQKKLKQLLQSQQSQLQSLQALKKLGGQNLQKTERVKNLIGSDSVLDPTVIPKVAAEMSEASTSTIFDKSTNSTKTMVSKIINNKRINLQPLNPIQQLPQIVEQFAELLNCGNQKVEADLVDMLENGDYDAEYLKQMVLNAGSSQQEMAKLLTYLDHKPGKDTPVQEWPQNLGQSEEDSNYLDFDLQKNQITTFPDLKEQDSIQQSERQRTGFKTRYKKKELPQIHLPSQPIYLQRIQGAHEVQKNKNIRKKRKKVERQADKFMDEDNEIYDLNF